jgi:hypothetical protein
MSANGLSCGVVLLRTILVQHHCKVHTTYTDIQVQALMRVCMLSFVTIVTSYMTCIVLFPEMYRTAF